MSRVFEALSKAAEEKGRDGENTTKQTVLQSVPITPAPAQVATMADSASPEWANGRNGIHVEKPESHLRSMPTSKPWREKLEELFFGWDLRRYSAHPIVALQEESPAAEQYKILREQMRRLRTEAGIRSIMVTSPVKRDGKTTVAVNLAAAIALEYEERVLLIDADLRNPRVHYYFGADGTRGLTDYLGSNSAESLQTLVRDTHLSGLQFIPAGKPSRFASELLAKDKMRALIEKIHSEFPDYTVIMDSPPVLGTPDPLVLSRHVDGIIVVVRASRTPKDYLAKALSNFNTTKILGVVLNGADLGLSSKYYYYSTNGSDNR
jgi:protein-tyrosine kinase